MMSPARPLNVRAARVRSFAGASLAGAWLAVALAACTLRSERPAGGVVDSATVADGFATGIASSGSRFVANIVGLDGPESARYDPEQDVFFISNMVGYGSVKNGNGYISRVSAADPTQATVLARGGQDGVTLDAPKGMTIHGDTLWVADIDVLRGFDRHTGAPLATIDFAPLHAVLLNDVAAGPDGSLYITDTGILMNEAGVVHTGPDRIFAVGPDRRISVIAAGPQLRRPNGVTWDASAKRWLVVSFDPFVGEVAAMRDGDSTRQVIRTGTGKLDGVEVLADGAILFTSWADSSVHLLSGGRDRQLVRQLPVPADLGVDTRRNRVAIPLSNSGRVELWALPARP